jgi:hypothetical protein
MLYIGRKEKKKKKKGRIQKKIEKKMKLWGGTRGTEGKPKKEEEELKRKKHTQGDASSRECLYIVLYYTATREERKWM